MRTIVRLLTLAACPIAVVALAVPSSANVRDDAGKQAGMCLYAGPIDIALLSDLAAQGRFVVQCLVPDATPGSARGSLRSAHIEAFVSAVAPTGGFLSHVDNCIDLAVINGPSALSALSLNKAELLRVVAPEGVVLEGSPGSWTRTTKPRPSTMGEWNKGTTPCFTNDTELDVPFELRWTSGPRWGNSPTSGILGNIAQGGVLYTISSLAVSNELPGAVSMGVPHPVVVARNAYNGMVLWELPYKDYGITETPAGRETRRKMNFFAADRTRAFLYDDGTIVARDAQTGEKLFETADYTPIRFVAAAQGCLLVASEKILRGCSLADGTLKWTYPLTADPRGWRSNGDLFFLDLTTRVLAPRSESGTVAWERTDIAGLSGIITSDRGIVGVKGTAGFSALSESDGHTLWSVATTTGDYVRYFGGTIALGSSALDLATGAGNGSVELIPTHACQKHVTTPNLRVDSRFRVFDRNGTMVDSVVGMRSPCVNGGIVANGLAYGTPENCVCREDQIMDHAAFGKSRRIATKDDFVASRAPVAGPAAGQTPGATQRWDHAMAC